MTEIMGKNNRPLKILQVISTPPFAWATGGCARVVFDLSKELVKQGHEVTILTTDMYKPNQRYESQNPEFVEGIRIIRYKYISDYLAWDKKIYISPGMIKYLKNNLKEYDIVHLEDLLSLQGIITSKFCKKFDIPYIITAHGSLPFLIKNKILNKLIFKNILLRSSKAIALTNQESDLYKKLGLNGNKIEIIPNGIDLTNNPIEIGLFRKKHKIEKNKKIILYLGRIHKTKGINTLINVFDKVLDDNKDVILVIAGPDDGYLQKIQNKAKRLKIMDKILFTGPLYGNEKFEAYTDSDLFVTPKFSGFPLTFLESCSCGTPIITTNHIDSLDWINDNVGYVVDYNEKKLAESIIKVLSDSSIRNRFKYNSKMVIQKFTWKTIAENIENIYIKVLSE